MIEILNMISLRKLGLFVAVAASMLGSQTAIGQLSELEVREGTGVPSEVSAIYEKGVEYLARTQNDNGSWEEASQQHGKETSGVCALCTMAFLSTGEDPNFGKYAENTRRALRYIILSQEENGYIPGNMYVHGFSMLALSEAYGVVDDEMLWAGYEGARTTKTIAETLHDAVSLAVSSQKGNPLKGWRYGPKDKTADSSVVGAVLMGLLAARNAGFEVPDESIDGAIEYIRSLTDATSGYVGYVRASSSPSAARTSIASLVLSIGKRADLTEWEATRNNLVDNASTTQRASSWPYYTRYYLAQALFQADYERWQLWNTEVIRKLGNEQADTGQIGESRHGAAYSTSMSLLALALNYRFLPIYER